MKTKHPSPKAERAASFLEMNDTAVVRDRIARSKKLVSFGDDYRDWKFLVPRRDDKQLVAGTVLFWKEDREWYFALGLRGSGKDGKGDNVNRWSFPVGRSRQTCYPEKDIERLAELGWIRPDDRSDELLYTAVMKLEEEFLHSASLQCFAGRMRPFKGDKPSILVNLFLYIPDVLKSSELTCDGQDITQIQPIPARELLECPPDRAGYEIDAWLQRLHPDTTLMYGLYSAGMRRLQEFLVETCG